MLFRFALYGFLKNLRFFEPFLILYFLSLGLNFLQIGILVSYREIVVNVLEIPSGTFADMFGKKHSMIASFIAYIFSFTVFSFFSSYPMFFVAFTFFAIGEAFRTGTHKAIIFDYLKSRGMEDQKTRIYGFTRSWSKIGSALSAVIAAFIMFFAHDYRAVFWASIIPYVFNIVNFTGYPKDKVNKGKHKKIALFVKELKGSFKLCIGHKPLRHLLIASMSYEGVFNIAKEYLQPIIQAFALSLPYLLYLDNQKRTALVIGVVYMIIYTLSSISSRSSYRFVKGGDHRRTLVYLGILTIFLQLFVSLFLALAWTLLAIVIFLGLYMMQNIWRPITITLVNELSPAEKATAILSVESQSKSLFIFLFAPVFGFLIDLTGIYALGLIASLFLGISFLSIRAKAG